MNKLFRLKKDKISLIKNKDNGVNNSIYTVEIGEGMLGVELEIYKDKYYICDVMREEIKDKITLNDRLIKINDKNIEDLSLVDVLKLCKKLKNKNKKLVLMETNTF